MSDDADLGRPIKVWFTGFWPGFNRADNRITEILDAITAFEFDAENPDFLFYSCFDYLHYNYDCVRIFFTGENIAPNFAECDYAIAYDRIDFGDRYLRAIHNWLSEEMVAELTHPQQMTVEDLERKPEFCNFIFSNPHADPMRDAVFHALNGRRHVESFGRHLRNSTRKIDDRHHMDWQSSKIDAMKPFRFTLALENSSYPGYTTEKLIDAFVARTVPIYWGNPEASRDFNSSSFVNIHDFGSLDEAMDHVLKLDDDPEAYLEVLNTPPFDSEQKADQFSRSRLEGFIRRIVRQGPVAARRRPTHGWQQNYEARFRKIGWLETKYRTLRNLKANASSAVQRFLPTGRR